MTKQLDYDILIKPLVTEKSALSLELNQYTFLVRPEAHKTELKQVFEALYPGRKVRSIRTIKIYPKARRAGRKVIVSAIGKKAVFVIDGDPIEVIAAGGAA